ncbi:exo-alpha-sialidase [Planctomicrobium sp. SH661]|uniref:sialidase family protein n=1 Tax=Planctomicrobium sp. SH661 TaxID=3448124 RepID=UPI003F5B3D73
MSNRIKLWIMTCGFLLVSASLARADELRVDLASAKAGQQWRWPSPDLVNIADGELILDGRHEISPAFYTPVTMGDGTITAKFQVEDQPQGVLACGFILGATDSRNFHFVHFDRGQAILSRWTPEHEWIEVHRVGGLEKPAGKWHAARIETRGKTVAVSLNGKPLFEVEAKSLERGRIGFYGSEGLVRVKDISISGDIQKATGDFTIQPRPYVIVCSDAGAGAYEAFPDVCRLNDGRLMVAFYAGYSHIAFPNSELPLGGRLSFCTSSDEGATWSPAKTLYDGPEDDRDPSIVQLPNGRILCSFFTYIENDRTTGTYIVYSDDLGETWSEPVLISKVDFVSSPVRVLSNGRLIMPLYLYGPQPDGGEKHTGGVTISDDNGTTWSKVIEMDNGGVRLDAETDLIELKDGTLYAALREAMCYSISKDQGETWSVAKPIGFAGHSPYLHRTSTGEIVLAYREVGNPSAPHTTNLRVSRDECKTWGESVLVDNVTGGYPSMVNLKDGTTLIVYYEEGPGSNIRAKRFRVTKDGVEMLGVPAAEAK